jgi:hypothetical protein
MMASFSGNIEDLPEGIIIPEGFKITVESKTGFVPVYLPDRTVIGRASIDNDGQTVIMEIKHGAVLELMSENLVGLSVVYKTNEARDRASEEGDKQDG